MNCTGCGAALPEGAAFCSQCGAPVGAGGAARMRRGGNGKNHDVPEEPLWSGAYAPMAMVGHFVGASVLTLVGVFLAAMSGRPVGWYLVGGGAALLFAYLTLLVLYRRYSIHYRLTTQRLLRDEGIISKRSDHLLVVNIDDVTVRQNIFDRLFNLGTIELHTKDKTTPDLKMLGIENPRGVADMIDEVRRIERNRRGLYTMDA
ncbi:MAG: PH domain-containing protein [Pirellulales bacterium]|nr:PH domain-containing protein [Pirellulales bacterium]